MSTTVRRRQFLRSSVAAAAGLAAPRPCWAILRDSPSERVNVASIGAAGKGASDSEQVAKVASVVALCDIDDRRLGPRRGVFPKARAFNDYRKLLDEMHKEIDAVIVSTADHSHAPASLSAMRLGKHVYCQKPLTHSVGEARRMREMARKQGVVTQMGNQGTAADGFRRGVEIIRSGAVGGIREVHVWTNRPFRDWKNGVMYWKQAPDLVVRPKSGDPAPSHVHWDLFLGTAPARPWNPVYHPHDWRGWWDFGTGALGDMGCHTANLPFMGLELGLPTRVSARSGPVNLETYPAWATITYEFPARGKLPPVRFTWYEGASKGVRNLPPAKLFHGMTPSSSGCLLVGEKGSIFSSNDYGAEQTLLPQRDFEGYRPPTPTLPRLGGGHADSSQKREWVEAIRGGPKPRSNFDYSSVLTEAMLLGNVAVRFGKPIEYDAAQGRVTNLREADEFIHKKYRDTWNI